MCSRQQGALIKAIVKRADPDHRWTGHKGQGLNKGPNGFCLNRYQRLEPVNKKKIVIMLGKSV